jgi:hypothetical protein
MMRILMSNKRHKLSLIKFTILAGVATLPCVGSAQAASAEAQARMYLAIAGATRHMEQLLDKENKLDGVSTYILYDGRLENDLITERNFEFPLDLLYFQVYPPAQSNSDSYNGSELRGANALKQSQELTDVQKMHSDFGVALAGLSLSGVISTLSSAAGISTAWFSQSTTANGVTGPTDADAFIATTLISDLKGIKTVFAPSIFPLFADNLSLTSLAPTSTSNLGPADVDPVTEYYRLSAKLSSMLKEEQLNLLRDYNDFVKVKAPVKGVPLGLTKQKTLAQDTNPSSSDTKNKQTIVSHVTTQTTTTFTPPGSPNAAAAYTTLVSDLKTAISWSPSPAPTAQISYPLACVLADIQVLKATLLPATSGHPNALMTKLTQLEGKLTDQPSRIYLGSSPDERLLDYTVRIVLALNNLGSTLSTTVAPYGTPTSASPAAGIPDTVANVVTRGWKIRKLLLLPDIRLLRVHLETSQGTDKATSAFAGLKWWKDSSAVANISFMVFHNASQPDFASWSLAYYPFQNADNALDYSRIQWLDPIMLSKEEQFKKKH